jgi:hypothetical protein
MRKAEDLTGVSCESERNGLSEPESISSELPHDDALQQLYLAQVLTSKGFGMLDCYFGFVYQ